MTITLEAIKADHSRLAEKIAAFEAQQARIIIFPSAEIRLADGEHYAGVITSKDGQRAHHVVLLPGDESLTWANTKDWAKKTGGELPTRREQALLYANLKEQFQSSWYWSSEIHASDSDYAWSQDFDHGGQSYNDVNGKLRVRAVRRIAI